MKKPIWELDFPPDPETILVRAAVWTASTMDAVHLVMHRIHVRTAYIELGGTPDDLEDASREHSARIIARINREQGWSNVPITGDYWDDFDAALEPRTIYPGHSNMIAGARSPSGKRPVWTTNFRLDRPHLELVLLADLVNSARYYSKSYIGFMDWDAESAAVTEAQALFANDREAALDQIATPLFKGTPEQRRRQLGWLLDGVEAETVICHRCYHPVDDDDPYLVQDEEAEMAWRRRRHDGLARYSAHADCHAAHPEMARRAGY